MDKNRAEHPPLGIGLIFLSALPWTNGRGAVTASFRQVFNNFRTSFWNRLAQSRGKEGFPLHRYIAISTQRHVSPPPTPGFKLKRGKLIQSSKFIGWKSSRHKRASSLQGQSCPAGLTLSYLLLNARPFLVNFSVFLLIHFPWTFLVEPRVKRAFSTLYHRYSNVTVSDGHSYVWSELL